MEYFNFRRSNFIAQFLYIFYKNRLLRTLPNNKEGYQPEIVYVNNSKQICIVYSIGIDSSMCARERARLCVCDAASYALDGVYLLQQETCIIHNIDALKSLIWLLLAVVVLCYLYFGPICVPACLAVCV